MSNRMLDAYITLMLCSLAGAVTGFVISYHGTVTLFTIAATLIGLIIGQGVGVVVLYIENRTRR